MKIEELIDNLKKAKLARKLPLGSIYEWLNLSEGNVVMAIHFLEEYKALKDRSVPK